MAERPETDILIAGAGPAGLALAEALVGHGLSVRVLDPAWERPWPNRYACWLDEAEGPLLRAIGAQWDGVRVQAGDGRARWLARPYVALDAPTMQRGLLRAVSAAGGDVRAGRVDALLPSRRSMASIATGGGVVHARAVVDATGARGTLTRTAALAGAAQTAFGILAEVEPGSALPDVPVLMDLRDPPDADTAIPSFLYALPFPDGRIFLEETTLIRRPAVRIGELRRRLQRRLRALGVRVRRVHHVERCYIPMDVPVPPRRRPVLAFGAAAGAVHPATGYQVAHTVATAGRVAGALASALADGADPMEASVAGFDALWPPGALRTHALHRFGAEVAARLDASETRRFFDAFFGLPSAEWSGFLSRRLSAGATARAMLRQFQGLDGPLRRRMVALGARHVSALLPAVWPRLPRPARRQGLLPAVHTANTTLTAGAGHATADAHSWRAP